MKTILVTGDFLIDHHISQQKKDRDAILNYPKIAALAELKIVSKASSAAEFNEAGNA